MSHSDHKKKVVIEPRTSPGSTGYNTYICAGGQKIYVDWQDLFDLTRQFAELEEDKRTPMSSPRFEGKRRIARLVKLAAGCTISWSKAKERLGL
jgi:hypothetical protein